MLVIFLLGAWLIVWLVLATPCPAVLWLEWQGRLSSAGLGSSSSADLSAVLLYCHTADCVRICPSCAALCAQITHAFPVLVLLGGLARPD